MYAKTRKALLLASVILLSSAVAQAQQTDAIGQLLQREAALAPNGVDSAPVDERQQTVRVGARTPARASADLTRAP